jgi:hypothetical protein
MNSEILKAAGLCYVILPRSFEIHSECELRSSCSPNTIECRWQAAHQGFDKKKMQVSGEGAGETCGRKGHCHTCCKVRLTYS